MHRRLFLNRVGKSAFAAAAGTGVLSQLASANNPPPPFKVKDLPKITTYLPDDVARLPRDLEKLVGDTRLLRKPENLTVAAYLFPNYHPSALHNKLYGKGWTEYELVRNARPWFQGHKQPRGPLLGELDESQPSTWEKYNTLANKVV